MARTIYKYAVGPAMTLALPREAQPLTVQLQHGVPQLWVVLDPEAPTIARTFALYSTGQPLPEGALGYIGTFQIEAGGFVFHLFELR